VDLEVGGSASGLDANLSMTVNPREVALLTLHVLGLALLRLSLLGQTFPLYR
jgi:hypothetical protein